MAEQIPLKAWKAPRISPAAVRIRNAVLRQGTGWTVPFGGAGLALSPDFAAAPADAAIAIAATLGEDAWLIEVSSDAPLLAHPILASVRSQYPQAGMLPEGLRAALAEDLAAPLLAALGRALGVSAACGDIAFGSQPAAAPAGAQAVGLCASIPGLAQFAVRAVPSSAEALQRLASRLELCPARSGGILSQGLASIPVRLSLRAGSAQLPYAQFQKLSLGDVIIAEDWMPARGAAEAVFISAGRPLLAAPCTVSGGQATLSADPAPTGGKKMPESKSLDVTLTFELEQRTVTVGELESVRAGTVFQMPAKEAPVAILANGKPVALGRLVDINGTLGVEITQPA